MHKGWYFYLYVCISFLVLLGLSLASCDHSTPTTSLSPTDVTATVTGTIGTGIIHPPSVTVTSSPTPLPETGVWFLIDRSGSIYDDDDGHICTSEQRATLYQLPRFFARVGGMLDRENFPLSLGVAAFGVKDNDPQSPVDTLIPMTDVVRFTKVSVQYPFPLDNLQWRDGYPEALNDSTGVLDAFSVKKLVLLTDGTFSHNLITTTVGNALREMTGAEIDVYVVLCNGEDRESKSNWEKWLPAGHLYYADEPEKKWVPALAQALIGEVLPTDEETSGWLDGNNNFWVPGNAHSLIVDVAFLGDDSSIDVSEEPGEHRSQRKPQHCVEFLPPPPNLHKYYIDPLSFYAGCGQRQYSSGCFIRPAEAGGTLTKSASPGT